VCPNVVRPPLTDLILEISILEKPALNELSGKALVRPFTIRGNVVLQAGYTVNYEMLLQNLSSDCKCIANVDVVSVHWLPEAGSRWCVLRTACEIGTGRENTVAAIGHDSLRPNQQVRTRADVARLPHGLNRSFRTPTCFSFPSRRDRPRLARLPRL